MRDRIFWRPWGARLGLSSGVLLSSFLLGCDGTSGSPSPAQRASASSAEDSGSEIVLTDDVGQVVRLDAPAGRVISLIPARTDAILALGAADRLVARTQWDVDARLAHLPTIENALLPSIEWIVARAPDLVIVWPDAETRTVAGRMRALGIPTYGSRVETLADVRRAVTHLGLLLGLSGAADSVLAAMDSTFADVRARVAGLPVRRVAYVVGIEPFTVAGPGTFPHELIELAGGSNIFADAGATWPAASMETMVERDPEVVFITVDVGAGDGELEPLRSRPGWPDLSAVREGRVYVLDADLFNRAGPALAPAALELARRIHPEAFEQR